MRWRDQQMLLEAIINDHEEHVSLHFDHGMECNMLLKLKGDKEEEAKDGASSK